MARRSVTDRGRLRYLNLQSRLELPAWYHPLLPCPSCPHDQKQPHPDDRDPNSSRDALTSRREAFDGNGRRHEGHRAEIHDSDDEEDHHQTDAAAAALESETQAMSPSRGHIGRERMAAPWRLAAAGKLPRLPCGELEETHE